MREFLLFCRHSHEILQYMRGVLLVLILALLGCAVVVAQVEDIAFGEALYFILITGLTVGYGDVVPITITGRIASIIAAVIGVIYVGIVVAVANRALKDVIQHKRSLRDGAEHDGNDR